MLHHCKVIACKNPYAWAFFADINPKDIENRTQPLSWRGLVLIHASLKSDRWYWDIGCSVCRRNGLIVPPRAEMQWGEIIGVVEMYGCVWSERADGGWGFPGQFHYYMRNPRKFAHPIPHTGTLHHPDYYLSDDELSYHINGRVAA